MLKIAFAAPVNYSEHHGILTLIAYLENYAKNIVSEIRFFNMNDRSFALRITAFRPDVIGYSVMTGEHLKMTEINRLLKTRFQFLSVFGGAHPTFFPDLINEDGVDVVVRGEGERAFLQLLRNVKNGRLTHLDRIQNLWVKLSKDKIVKNDLDRNVEDISKLPFSNRKILYDEFSLLKRGGLKTFILSRGCPYRCTYCYNYKIQEMYGHKFFRFLNPERAVREIKLIKELYPLSFIQFSDDIIFPNTDWLREFSGLYRREIGIPFNANIRPDMITSERTRYLKMAGCYSINMAIEHGDYNYRRDILNRNIKDQTIIDATKMLKEQGILVACQSMIGLPHSDIDGDIKTIDLNIRVNPDNPIVHIFQPYPGTRLGDYCIDKGIFKGSHDNIYETTYDTSVIEDQGYVRRLHYYFPFLVKFKLRNPRILKKLLSSVQIPFSNIMFFLYKYFVYKRVVKVRETLPIKLLRIITILKFGPFGSIKVKNK